MKSPAPTEELRGLHGLWWSLYEAGIVLALVNGHEAPLFVCGDIEKRVCHAERFEDVLAEVVLQGLATDYLDQFPQPIRTDSVLPSGPGIKQDRRLQKTCASLGDDGNRTSEAQVFCRRRACLIEIGRAYDCT